MSVNSGLRSMSADIMIMRSTSGFQLAQAERRLPLPTPSTISILRPLSQITGDQTVVVRMLWAGAWMAEN